MVDSYWDRLGGVIQGDQLLFGAQFPMVQQFEARGGPKRRPLGFEGILFFLVERDVDLYMKYMKYQMSCDGIYCLVTEYGIRSRNKDATDERHS
jgi:hypothetical protein